MSGNTKAKPEGLLGLSISEAKTMLLGILCTEGSNKVDFEKLAVRGNYKNSSSAGSLYRQVRRKFLDANGELPRAPNTGDTAGGMGNTNTTPTPKKTPGRKKRTTPDVNPDHANEKGGGGELASPTPNPKPKRQRQTPVKTQAMVKVEVRCENAGNGNGNENLFSYDEPEYIVKMESDSSNPAIKSEEDVSMADVNIDAEFAEMERAKAMAN